MLQLHRMIAPAACILQISKIFQCIFILFDAYVPSSPIYRTRPPLAVIALVWHQILNALVHLHQLKIMHCDVKPKNILVEANTMHIRLFDLGLAREGSTDPETDALSVQVLFDTHPRSFFKWHFHYHRTLSTQDTTHTADPL